MEICAEDSRPSTPYTFAAAILDQRRTISPATMILRSAEANARIVQETYAPGMSVSLVAPQNRIAPDQVFTWRRLTRLPPHKELSDEWRDPALNEPRHWSCKLHGFLTA
jgi:hypothetical protein